MIDILFISPADFHKKPQTGTHREMEWEDFCEWLSEPVWGEAKDAVGGWSPCLYEDNIRRKANVIHACAVVVDVDYGGDIDAFAKEFEAHDAVLLETFSSTVGAPRCRLVLRLSRPISTHEHDQIHGAIRARIASSLQVKVDESAKDVSRLSYSPVRRFGSGYGFATCTGSPLDVDRVLSSLPPPKPIERKALVFHRPTDQSRYVQGAIRRAQENILSAGEGNRHGMLCREAWGLARLGLTLAQTRDALGSVALSAMGEARKGEIERTIADCYYARKRAS